MIKDGKTLADPCFLLNLPWTRRVFFFIIIFLLKSRAQDDTVLILLYPSPSHLDKKLLICPYINILIFF